MIFFSIMNLTKKHFFYIIFLFLLLAIFILNISPDFSSHSIAYAENIQLSTDSKYKIVYETYCAIVQQLPAHQKTFALSWWMEHYSFYLTEIQSLKTSPELVSLANQMFNAMNKAYHILQNDIHAANMHNKGIFAVLGVSLLGLVLIWYRMYRGSRGSGHNTGTGTGNNTGTGTVLVIQLMMFLDWLFYND